MSLFLSLRPAWFRVNVGMVGTKFIRPPGSAPRVHLIYTKHPQKKISGGYLGSAGRVCGAEHFNQELNSEKGGANIFIFDRAAPRPERQDLLSTQ